MVKHFFGISVSNEDELIKYWHFYVRHQMESSNSWTKAVNTKI